MQVLHLKRHRGGGNALPALSTPGQSTSNGRGWTGVAGREKPLLVGCKLINTWTESAHLGW